MDVDVDESDAAGGSGRGGKTAESSEARAAGAGGVELLQVIRTHGASSGRDTQAAVAAAEVVVEVESHAAFQTFPPFETITVFFFPRKSYKFTGIFDFFFSLLPSGTLHLLFTIRLRLLHCCCDETINRQEFQTKIHPYPTPSPPSP